MLDSLKSPLALIGRVLLALMFVKAGFGKLGNIDGTAAYIASGGLPLPAVLAVLAGLFELLAGLALAVGFKTRWAALALGVFTLLASVMMGAFAAAAIAACANPLIEVASGREFLGAHATLILMAASIPLTAMTAPLTAVMKALDGVRAAFYCDLAWACVYVGLMLLFASSLGLVGTGWAQLAASAAQWARSAARPADTPSCCAGHRQRAQRQGGTARPAQECRPAAW